MVIKRPGDEKAMSRLIECGRIDSVSDRISIGMIENHRCQQPANTLALSGPADFQLRLEREGIRDDCHKAGFKKLAKLQFGGREAARADLHCWSQRGGKIELP